MNAKLESYGKKYDITIEVHEYSNPRNLALQLMYMDEEFGCKMPFAMLTVNLNGHVCEKNCSFVDTNNCEFAEEFITKYNLGRPTSRIGISGFCAYPEYEFNMTEIRKYTE